ncbi:MAG: cupin domain-containing protein [Microcystaceae cyanobacterium]
MLPHCMIPVLTTSQDYNAYRISPDDHNRLVIITDPTIANTSLTLCFEIFEVGGKTPLHQHQKAVEMFFILKGKGMGQCDGKVIHFQAGDSIIMPSMGVHGIENTGTTRLYVLSIMVGNEEFAKLVRSGIPVELDEEDLKVLRGV